MRRQVQQALARLQSEGAYPRRYFNRTPQDLSAQPPYMEYPITPSPQSGSAPSNYRRGVEPGPVRAFYNNGDRSKFDVGYHDPARAPTGREMGGNIRAPLTLWRRTIRHLRIPTFARSGASKPLSFVTLIARGAYYLL